MSDHDILESALKEKELLEKMKPQFEQIQDLDEILKQAESPKIMALLMFRVIQEREKTNKTLDNINDKFDKIMLNLKTTHQNYDGEPHLNEKSDGRFEVLSEQDQLILKSVEERGGCTATDIKTMLNYKGLNAACQRLNKLFREGHLKKIQQGKKVLYLAKS